MRAVVIILAFGLLAAPAAGAFATYQELIPLYRTVSTPVSMAIRCWWLRGLIMRIFN